MISGTAELWLENDDGVLEKKIIHEGAFFNVSPFKKHRIIALTDVITQEVSTPEVDDVIRIEDDTHRKDGRIDEEQQVPSVLILAAGLGTRLNKFTTNKNKALIPINNKAIISYIIEKFPKEYEIVIAVGYKKESLKEYCSIAHSDRKIIFVDVNGWEDSKVGPGYSAFQCKDYLQKPFYVVAADCIIDSDLPRLYEDWIGVSPTSYPEKYSTVKVDENGNVVEFVNKSNTGFDDAFIGLAGVWNYKIFWNELETDNKNWESVWAWKNPSVYPVLKAKKLTWIDTGNFDDLQKAKEHFKDKPISLSKNLEEVTYKVGTRFLKFNPQNRITKNRYERGIKLKNIIPKNFSGTENFIYYDWNDGITMYECNSLQTYMKFLSWYEDIVINSETYDAPELIKPFYVDKTEERKNMFLSRYGNSYATTEYTINGKKYPAIQEMLNKID